MLVTQHQLGQARAQLGRRWRQGGSLQGRRTGQGQGSSAGPPLPNAFPPCQLPQARSAQRARRMRCRLAARSDAPRSAAARQVRLGLARSRPVRGR
jgi:hypothetical protein